jgi:hypothetical protein
MITDREWLEDQYENTLKWIFDVCFGRGTATNQELGDKIHFFGTIKRLIGRDR